MRTTMRAKRNDFTTDLRNQEAGPDAQYLGSL
jgi:hypothetical protein